MKNTWFCSVVLAVLLTAVPNAVFAQTSFIGGSVGLLTRAEGDDDAPYLSGTVSGTAPRVTFEAGWHLNPRVSLGPELSFGPALEAEQGARVTEGAFGFTSQYSEVLAVLAMKFHFQQTALLSVEPVLGGGILFRSSDRVGTIFWLGPDDLAHEEEVSAAVPALIAGLDLAINLTDAVSLTPGVRLQVAVDDDEDRDGVREFGISRTALYGGVGLRVRF